MNKSKYECYAEQFGVTKPPPIQKQKYDFIQFKNNAQ